LTASRPDLATSESHILINSVGEGPSATEFLTQAITKMENFIMAQESSLSAIFSVMDTDSDREIRIDEFRNKARMLKIDLNDEESRALFIHIDKDSGGTISYKEFVQSFAPINTKQMIKNMDKIINSSKANPEAIFDLYTSDKSKKSLVR
jgi:Ca2+-binding EF-hand superfamily protein